MTGSLSSSWRSRLGGSARGWCCHSSASTTSTSPSASAGIACSGSASTSSQRRRGASRASASIAGIASLSVTDWKPATRAAAGDRAGRGGEVGLGERGALEQRVGVLDERERRVGQAHAAAGALEQRHAGLALEHRQLLGDRRGRELQRVGDRGDRPAVVQLAQQADAAEVEHSVGTLMHSPSEIGIDAHGSGWHDAAPMSRPPPAPSSASPRAPPSARWRCSASSPTTRARRSARCSRVRFTLAAALFWVLIPLREIRALPRRDVRTGLALGACGYALQAGCYFVALGRIEAPLLALLLYTFPAIVAVAAVALGRERFGSAARDRASASPRGGLDARGGRRGRRRARSARRRARPRRRARLQRLHPRQRRRSRGASARSCWRRSSAPARR